MMKMCGRNDSIVSFVRVSCICRLPPSLIDEFLLILVTVEVRQRITYISDALADSLNIGCVLPRIEECLKQKLEGKL